MEMYNYDDFGTNLWQNLGDFVCNSKVSVPVEILQKPSHQITSNCFYYVEHSSTQSSTCSITKDIKMAMARWLSKYFSSVLKSIIVQNIGGRGF